MRTNDYPLPSYFGYIGSKSSMAEELIRRMPPEAYESYCEVFAGGLGLFLKKPKAKVNIANDLDMDLIETHATVAAQPEAVMAGLAKLRPCRSVFDRLRLLRDAAEWRDLSPPERAATFIYIAKCSVNGNMQSFSNSSKTTSNFNPRFDLRPYSAKFDAVTFENLHWRELLHRLVFKPKDVSLFLYIDPPYIVADSRKHYRFNFDSVEHLMLAHALARINDLNDGGARNVKIMISYDDDPDEYVRSLYRPEFGWHVATISTTYIAEHRANRGTEELVITNYAPNGLAISQAVGGGFGVAMEPSNRRTVASAKVKGVAA